MNCKNCHRSRIEVKPTAFLRYHAHMRWTLTFNVDLWLWPVILIFYPRRAVLMAHTHKIKFKNNTVQKRSKNKRTDRQTRPIALPFPLMRSISNTNLCRRWPWTRIIRSGTGDISAGRWCSRRLRSWGRHWWWVPRRADWSLGANRSAANLSHGASWNRIN